jgi:hypothetical protein
MAIMLASVHLPHVSGIPEDEVINSFVINNPAGAIDPPSVNGALHEFYNVDVAAGGPHNVANYIGEQISRAASACKVRWYDLTGHLDGSPHGSPVAETAITLGAVNPGALSLPSELCVVISTHGDLSNVLEEAGNTRPRARLRGRSYIGPLSSIAMDQDASSKRVRVTLQCRATMAGAMARLMNAAGFDLCVWSRLNASASTVVGGFVDDGFDVQRRRGEKSTLRSTFGV